MDTKVLRKQQEDIKEIILNVARNIFSKFGFKKTTMDEIAQAAMKAKSSIYYYFKSKEEIFEAVVEKEGNIMYEELMKIINSNADSQTKLRKYILTRMKLIDHLANLYDAIKDDYLNHFTFIQKYRKKYDEFEISMIMQMLQQGIYNKEFKINNNIETIAYAISTALKGLEIPFFLENKYAEIEKRLDSLLDILFYGIAKK